MEEQSHKQEMAAALRGDFERLRARRGVTETPLPASPTAPPRSVEPSHEDGSRRSVVARLLGRSAGLEADV